MQLVREGEHFTWGAPSEATAFGSPQLHSVTAVLIPHEDLLLVCFLSLGLRGAPRGEDVPATHAAAALAPEK